MSMNASLVEISPALLARLKIATANVESLVRPTFSVEPGLTNLETVKRPMLSASAGTIRAFAGEANPGATCREGALMGAHG